MPRGEEGEIVTKADYPVLFKGYYNQPEKTAEPLRGDGWHRTGDLAHMDSDGYVWFHSRKDDVISSGGYRIGPSEVEGAVLAHPAVRDAAVSASPTRRAARSSRRGSSLTRRRAGGRAAAALPGAGTTRARWSSSPSCRAPRRARSGVSSCARSMRSVPRPRRGSQAMSDTETSPVTDS